MSCDISKQHSKMNRSWTRYPSMPLVIQVHGTRGAHIVEWLRQTHHQRVPEVRNKEAAIKSHLHQDIQVIGNGMAFGSRESETVSNPVSTKLCCSAVLAAVEPLR